MFDAISSALTGVQAATRRLENSANNTANINTAGFKAGQVEETSLPHGGVASTASSRSAAQGAVIPQSDPLALAISGRGFFQVTLPEGGTGFTRAGNFKVDGGGRVVTADGQPLAPEITVPGNSTGIDVNTGGQVFAKVDGAPVNIGQIQLADFNNPAGLTAAGGNLFLETAASGAPVAGNPGTGGLGTVLQGALESSNVDIGREVVEQIVSKVAFQANLNVIKAASEMTGSLLDIKT